MASNNYIYSKAKKVLLCVRFFCRADSARFMFSL